MKYSLILVLLLSACTSYTDSDGKEKTCIGDGCEAGIHIADQCLRAELFKSCMAALPAGPLATKYNDWDEVVSECGSQSYYQSQRQIKFVKPECR